MGQLLSSSSSTEQKEKCGSDEESQIAVGTFDAWKLRRNTRKYYRYVGSLYVTVNTEEQNDEDERKQSENDDDMDNPKSNTAADKADEVAKTNLVNYREMTTESSNNAEEKDANENVEETPAINEVVEKLDLSNLNTREPNAATFKSILMVPSPIEKPQFSPRSAKVPLALDKTTLIVPTQSQNSCYEPVDNYVNTDEIINEEELSDREQPPPALSSKPKFTTTQQLQQLKTNWAQVCHCPEIIVEVCPEIIAKVCSEIAALNSSNATQKCNSNPKTAVANPKTGMPMKRAQQSYRSSFKIAQR
ncbi:hypothetical protein Vadar_030802 [Vaccinium darrowii]|uniref:Uncharacterized protein n=1 Tax=Vaccinium darrowii TaxID=229202 RepID=A0ACB7XDC1_9ERIC|nr:hypothetical protein Vadar_030802 [Vaccinium darrowii]